jgi:ppGpp synthetase/RelA/SpoT-type nucleotidyltranferase
MNWIIPKYSKAEINHAGTILVNTQAEREVTGELDTALKILENWRAAHSYPMHVFKVRLKSKATDIDHNALAAQRLKRATSILYKLVREYAGRKNPITLYEMQDIGGCRAVMSNAMLAKQLCETEYIKNRNLKHKLIKKNDYIQHPKSDGYRSLHLIYEFHSDKGKKAFNGLRVELQFRSKLQHQWATAAEIAGIITNEANIKGNRANQDWREFFKLLSSAFAQTEKLPQVENTPTNEKELYLAIKEKEKKLNIRKRLESWAIGLKKMTNWSIEKNRPHKNEKIQNQYFLLELDIQKGNLSITPYKAGNEKKAIEDYATLERQYRGDSLHDAVLVGVDTARELEKAYPNYFADTKDFLKELEKILNKY